MMFMEFDHSFCLFCTFEDDILDLLVDQGLDLLSVRLCVLSIGEGDIAELLVHAELGDKTMGQVVSFFEVVVGTGCDLVEEVEFCASTSQDEADSVEQFLLGLQLVFIYEILGETKSALGTGNNRYFQQRISAFQEPRYHSMSALMISYRLFLLDRHKSLSLHSSDYSLRRQLKIHHLNYLLTASCCQDSSFITQIGKLRSTEARTECGYSLSVLFFGVFGRQLDRSKVDQQNFVSSSQVRKAYLHFSVESTSADQCTVQDLFSVCGCQDNHAAVCTESVHFNQQLIQSAFSLIVGTHLVLSLLANCVQLINEDNRRS